MEPQKYYDFSHGFYCVFFPNRSGLSIEEIKGIFSEFGEVVNVTKAGDDYGYRFVKYRNEDEVIRCVEGLRNNQSVRLKVKDPHYKKNRNQTNNDNLANSSSGQKNYEHNGQSTEFNDNRNHRGSVSTNTDKNTDNRKQCVNDEDKKDKNSTTPQAGFRHCSAIEQRINDARRGTKNTSDHERVVQKLPEAQESYSDPSNRATSLRRPAVAPKHLTSMHEKILDDKNSSITSHGIPSGAQNAEAQVFRNEVPNSGLSTGLEDVETPVKLDDTADIPRLLVKNFVHNTTDNGEGLRSPCSMSIDTPKTKTAEEVVVANIHTDFGVNYILHLFQKHDPLSVSEMKMIPSLGLRFCIVYFQSMHQAYAIEKEFDKFKLSGKNLIVLRCERLAELSA